MNIKKDEDPIIWRLTDGKPGHQSQSQGLVNALKRKMACQSFDIPVSGRLQPVFDLLSTTWPAGHGLPLPDLIIGAGHRTHLHMLAAKKVYGGQTIVLMQPSLPVSFFDLSLIPEHDYYQGRGNVLETRGVLNPIHATGVHHTDKGLIMIGGPSKHCDWNENHITSQITQLCKQNPRIHYTLTTSPRTPANFATHMLGFKLANLTIVPFEETDRNWVSRQLAASYSAWISEDSVSMVYEALTANTAVGILNMPIKRDNRVSRGLSKLVGEGYAVRFDSLGHYKNRLQAVPGFMESERCADWIAKHWLDGVPQAQPQPIPQLS
ncbi:mitochondrial fission ELM1 family protein [Methylophaga sp.]|uniref:mitochondrial fission ELM1 family protein n=1 Tax=Methylophaga sp. TaxID=2024840 RepID=UPI003A8E5E7B